MSGNWAWEQAVCPLSTKCITSYLICECEQDIIAEDPDTHGAAFVPVIQGSDKTTVSVATGQNEYYPLYTSPGIV